MHVFNYSLGGLGSSRSDASRSKAVERDSNGVSLILVLFQDETHFYFSLHSHLNTLIRYYLPEHLTDPVSSVQKNCTDKDTFMPKIISLPKESYERMVRVMKLPFRGIETSGVVGPFFWSAYDQDDEDPHLRKFGTARYFINTLREGQYSDCIHRNCA